MSSTCYSAAYMSQTRCQKPFTVSEVGADWCELMIAQHIMWLSVTCTDEQLDPQCSPVILGFHPVARQLLNIHACSFIHFAAKNLAGL